MKPVKIISVVFFLALFTLLVYFFFFTSAGLNILATINNRLAPCADPISYRIGSIDPRFGVSREELRGITKKAEDIWETPIHKNLFEFKPDGTLVINLVYDYRQKATEELKKLGITLDTTEAAYNSMKQEYESLLAEHAQKKSELDSLVAAYRNSQAIYEAEVAQWNARGGAPRQEYKRLNTERDTLAAQAADIHIKQAEFNQLVEVINALVDEMNRVATELNLTVNTYNKIGDVRGEEFEEGLYKNNISGAQINIYEFDNVSRLTRVLAHEMGHALGLSHLEDPKAIMYKLNQGTNTALSAADVQALKKHCRLK